MLLKKLSSLLNMRKGWYREGKTEIVLWICFPSEMTIYSSQKGTKEKPSLTYKKCLIVRNKLVGGYNTLYRSNCILEEIRPYSSATKRFSI